MPNQRPTDPTKSFTCRFLPWIIGLGMLVVYLITLNRWVTLANLIPVAKVSGFLWQPDFFTPVTYLVTLPFRWIPVADVPLVMNIFSALCGAVVLGLLARCVAILPHDRTEMERNRERSDFAFLTTRSAWMPPVLAAVMFGLQLGFWLHATNFTGEMLALVPFAVVAWLLLEYRLDEKPWRLILAAAIFGGGIADNWAFIGFLPVFVIAVLWIKGWEFFNARFLFRMSLAGLAGMSLIFLMPVLGMFSTTHSFSFWEMLKPALRNNWLVMKAISYSTVRYNLLIMSVATFLPLLVMAIRWSASFGDSSRIGTMLSNYMFHVIHAVIFGTCVWVMFDPPFSPGQLSMGSPALTFYFLSALALGYYAGYYLLVFGNKAVATRRNPNPLPALPGPLEMLSPVVYWGTFAAAGYITAALIYKNLPQIRDQNDRTLLQYAQLTEQTLPAKGGILLTDSDSLTSSQMTRTLLMQVALARTPRGKDFMVVDTGALNWTPYHRYLHAKYPDKWPKLFEEKNDGQVPPILILGALVGLAQSNTVCYLNPSFGYYFEYFYQEPRGLVYQMNPLPEDTLLPPPLSTNLIAENQKFWQGALDNELAHVEAGLAVRDPQKVKSIFSPVLMRLHGKNEPNPNAVFVANLYSRAINYWGVQLQRAGKISEATEWFSTAQQLNPDNIVAGYNLEFNQALLAGTNVLIDPSRANADQFGKYRNWNAILNANGPFDEPSFVFANAALLAQSSSMRQALAEFARVRRYAPENLTIRLTLANLYLLNRLPVPALEALQDPLQQPGKFGLSISNSTELNALTAAAYFQKGDKAKGVKLIEHELNLHPDNLNFTTTAVQAFFLHGLYSNALEVINQQLARTPEDAQWLFGKGYANLQMSNYNQAVTAFTRVLQIATNDTTARFNRALAYLQSDRLKEARADYLELQTSFTNAFQIAYGLAEVAWRERNTNEAIRNYQLYLANAPTNAAELGIARERLKQLQKN